MSRHIYVYLLSIVACFRNYCLRTVGVVGVLVLHQVLATGEVAHERLDNPLGHFGLLLGDEAAPHVVGAPRVEH